MHSSDKILLNKYTHTYIMFEKSPVAQKYIPNSGIYTYSYNNFKSSLYYVFTTKLAS